MIEEKSNNLFSWLKEKKRLLIGIGTILLIVFMMYIVDFSRIINNLFIIGIFGILIFIFLYTITFFLRSYKLILIFKEFEQKILFSSSFFSIGTSFVINDSTPAKVGELAKIAFLKEQEDIKLSVAISGTAIERALNVIILFSITCFALVYLYFIDVSEGGTKKLLGLNLQFYIIIAALLLIGLIISLILIYYRNQFFLKIIRKISPSLASGILRIMINLKESLLNFKNHKKELILIILIEVAIWTFESLIGVIFFYLLGYRLNIFIIILAEIITFFSKIFPLTPGGWGVSENLGAIFIILFYPNLSYFEILAVFIIDHLFRSVYLLFYGGYSIFRYNFKLKNIDKIKSQLP